MSQEDDFYALIGQIQREYPDIFALINQPGILEAALEIVGHEMPGQTPMTDAQIQARLHNTPFFQQANPDSRQWYILAATDPAAMNQLKAQRAQKISSWLSQAGLQVTADEASFIASQSLARGEDEMTWKANLANSPFYASLVTRAQPGQTGQGAISDTLQAHAAEYAVPLSGPTIWDWQRQILAGQVDMDTFDSYLREQAKSLFPGLSNAIDRGITVAQYVQPYAQIAAKELNINPSEVDWTDPKWSTAIHQIDPKSGAPVSMSLDQWTSLLRTDSRYGFDQTQGAQDQATQLGQALAQRLGRAA